MRFEVWAPDASSVKLHVEGYASAMASGLGGWWFADVPVGPDCRYAFSLDGGAPWPDPRSPRQPDGIDHASATFDTSEYEWHDRDWRGVALEGAVLYELHIGTFSAAGTFDGAIEHLSSLTELGVDAVEVMPIATGSGSRGWGYDGVQLFSVSEHYGGPAGFQRFVDACHRHGLAVLLDVVYNHLGPAGNHLCAFGPYFTARHTTPWGNAVNFDGPGSDEVRRFVLDNACRWLRDFHVDGLRLDAVHEMVDDSDVNLVAELSDTVAELARDLDRPLLLIAESDANDPALIRARPDGAGFDAVWSDDWHHALHTVLTGEASGYYEDFGSYGQLVKALGQAWVYDGNWSTHQQRHRGGSPAGLPAHRFIVCNQNHDQIGNRAQGERSSHLLSPRLLRVAAALLLTAPFTPMLFQGEEWGATSPFLYVTDHRDPQLAGAVRAGRLAEFAAFGWQPSDVPDSQAEDSFLRSKLDWDERSQPAAAELLEWHRSLLALRRAEPALHDPAVAAVATAWGGLVRIGRGDIVLLAALDDTTEVVANPTETCLLAAEGVVITRRAGRDG